MDTYADDLSALIETLHLKGTVLIGFSAGGGEVACYIGRHGTKRVVKVALISAVPPLMLKTVANPGGLPIEVFDKIRFGSIADRSQLYKDLAGGGEKRAEGAGDRAELFYSQQTGCRHLSRAADLDQRRPFAGATRHLLQVGG